MSEKEFPKGMEGREFPKYKCHKEVWALKIKSIRVTDTLRESDAYLEFEEEGFAPIHVTAGWMFKHKPTVGGYYVVYEDGYKSWSPAEAFEDGYTLIGE